MLKVGIIGTGRIFDLNVLGYLNNNDVEIICLCNRTVEKALKKIKQFNLNKSTPVYSNYKKMLNQEELDIVEILLPHNLHAEATIFAANEGIKGISVQKPMALSLEEANQMIEACNESGAILSIYENFLFLPHILKAKELIDQDYIGDLSYIRIKVAMGATGGWNIPESADLWRKDPKKIGGHPNRGSPILLDNGWHAFTLGWWFFGEEIEKVFAWADNYQGIDAPAYVMWKCKENKEQEHVVPQYGNMEFSLMPEMVIPSNYYNTDEFIEIIGSRGIMKINQGTAMGNIMSDSEIFAPIVIVRDGEVETYSDFEKDWKYSFINATKHFIEVVKGNKKPILSGKQARYILKLNLAAIQSVELGKDVYLVDMN
ncbi:MAG: Gfo/Idh/MocA family protein [Candidatus Hodarchaeota archaeon]